MDTKTTAALTAFLVLLNGCATVTRSTLLGAAIGGAAGATIGQAQSQNSEGTMTGAAIGVGIGALFGFLSHKEKKKEEAKVETKNVNDEENFPALTRPKLRSMWVPDKVEGNKYIKGHWIYIIEDPGSWSP